MAKEDDDRELLAGVWEAVGAFGADCGGPPALPLAGVGVWGAVGTFGVDDDD